MLSRRQLAGSLRARARRRSGPALIAVATLVVFATLSALAHVAPTQPSPSHACRTQVCPPELQGLGSPEPSLRCDPDDYVTHVHPDHLPNDARVGPLTPRAAIADFLATLHLPRARATSWVADGPRGLNGRSWSVFAQVPGHGARRRRLGLLYVEASSGFWLVTSFEACEEYLSS